MGKVSKALTAVGKIIKEPYQLNRILEDDQVWFDYLQKNSLPSSLHVLGIEHILDTEDKRTLPLHTFSDGGSMITDLLLLRALASSPDVKSYFEIGTWRGESAINVADKVERCLSLNLSDDQLRDIGKDHDYISQIGMLVNGVANVELVKGDSTAIDPASLGGPFDMVFIDGDHRHAFVKSDTRLVFESLIHENSVIVWHDYARSPQQTRPEVLAGILEGTPAEKRGGLFQMSHSLCAVYHPGLAKLAHPKSESTRPEKRFEVKVDWESL